MFSEESNDDAESIITLQTMNRKRKFSENNDNISVRSGSTLKYQGNTIIT